MISLCVYDIKNNKRFVLEKDYYSTIKLLKKYTYSRNIFCYDYSVKDYYSAYELNQLSYWYSRQYRLLK